MKRVLAVTFLLLSSALVALADGPDLPPMTGSTLPKGKPVMLADGPDLPPVTTVESAARSFAA